MKAHREGPSKCTDRWNCNMLNSVISISKVIEREPMEHEYMWFPQLKDDFGPIPIRYCPFCGYKYGSDLQN